MTTFNTTANRILSLPDKHVTSRTTKSPYGDSEQESSLLDSDLFSDDGEPSATSRRLSPGGGVSHQARRSSFLDEDSEPLAPVAENQDPQDSAPVTWRSLPNKGQLAVLTLARLSEPLAERSLSAYMFYQLRSFDPSLPDSKIASQGGMLTASFAAAQFLTAVWWGRAADSPRIGRKRVLLVGLTGTCISTIGVGFSRSYVTALCWRVLAGALNGNVGVMRTMISEIIQEKKFQSRAFLLLPMCFNIGVVIGPILGGFLADPIASFPSVFGPGSALGGKEGVSWMTKWPYSLPNIVSAVFILSSALAVVLGLDETHQALRQRTDYGRKLGRYLGGICTRANRSSYRYAQLENETDGDSTAIDLEEHPQSSLQLQVAQTSQTSHPKPEPASKAPPTTKPTIFTRNVLLTLLTHFLLALHISAFNALIFILLPAPRPDPASKTYTKPHPPFFFTGGLNLPSSRVGLATAIIGVLGLPLQLLFFPPIQARLGTLRSYRLFLPFSPLAYSLLPYLVLLPTRAVILWPALTAIFALQVVSRTFSLPSMTILVNNSAPHPSVLGTVHGFAQSVSSGARTLGPVVGGWCLGWGLRANMVGAVWWGMAAVALLNWSLLWILREGAN